MSSLTAGPANLNGTPVNSTPAPQANSANTLLGTYDVKNSGSWALNGAATVATPSFLYDGQYIDYKYSATNGSADFVSQSTAAGQVSAATVYTVQATVSADSDLSLANPSIACRVAVNWTGGVARLDFVDVNPVTGAVVATSGNLTSVQVTPYYPNSSGSVAKPVINVYKVTFTCPATPAGTTTGDFRIFPNVATSGAGQVQAGGFQIEASSIATAFIPTGPSVQALRGAGLIPRLLPDNYAYTQTLTGNRTYQPRVDMNTCFTVANANITITLPAAATMSGTGEFFYFSITGTGSITFDASATSGITGCGITAAPSVKFPYDGATPAGTVGPWNVRQGMLHWNGTLSIWEIIAASAGGTNTSTGKVAWTPIDSSGAGLAFSQAVGWYQTLGGIILFSGSVTYPVTASGANASIGGLPNAVLASTARGGASIIYTDATALIGVEPAGGASTLSLYKTNWAIAVNSDVSAKRIDFGGLYFK